MKEWGHSFANVLTRCDISMEDRLYACKTLADMATTEDKWQIACHPVVVEAIATIMAHSDKNYVNERHKAQLALAMTRCISRGGKEACMAYANNASLTDSLCKLTRHQEPFLQMAAMSAVCMLTRCDDAVGSNRRLLKAKWHNVLEADRKSQQQHSPVVHKILVEKGKEEMSSGISRPSRIHDNEPIPTSNNERPSTHGGVGADVGRGEMASGLGDSPGLLAARSLQTVPGLYGSERQARERGDEWGSMHKSNAGGLQTEDSFASSRATELAPELSVSGTERRSSFSSARSSQSNKDTLRDAYFMRNHANPMSPQVEPLKSRLNLRQDSMQRNFSPSSLMFRKETLHGDPLSPYRSTPLVPDGYLGLAREVSPEAEGPILPETV